MASTRYDQLIDCSPADVLRRDVVDEPGKSARRTGGKTLASGSAVYVINDLDNSLPQLQDRLKSTYHQSRIDAEILCAETTLNYDLHRKDGVVYIKLKFQVLLKGPTISHAS